MKRSEVDVAVAEYHPVVIPAGRPVLDGLVDDQVEFLGFGLAGEPVDFKDWGDFDHCEGNGVRLKFFPIFLDEQVGGFGRKTGGSDFDSHHFLKIFLNCALTDMQFVDGVGDRTMTPRLHFSLDLHIGGAVVQTKILILKFSRKFQHLPGRMLGERPSRLPRHRIIGVRRTSLNANQGEDA